MDIEQKEFSKMLGVSENTIYSYISGRRCPRLDIAIKIQEYTKGKVTINDLIDDWGKKRK